LSHPAVDIPTVEAADPAMLGSMTCADLPSDWAQRPIIDPDVFEGVIDLISAPADRSRGAAHLLLTHPDGRMLQPITVDDVPPGSPSVDSAARWGGLLQELADHGARSVVLVRSRPRPARKGPDDDAFFTVLTGAVARAGLDLLGGAIATPDGIVVLDLDGLDGLARPA
jgi:hypothetical protein